MLADEDCIVTRSRTSTGPVPSSWDGWLTKWWRPRGGRRRWGRRFSREYRSVLSMLARRFCHRKPWANHLCVRY